MIRRPLEPDEVKRGAMLAQSLADPVDRDAFRAWLKERQVHRLGSRMRTRPAVDHQNRADHDCKSHERDLPLISTKTQAHRDRYEKEGKLFRILDRRPEPHD